VLRTLLKFRNLDLTKDINDRYVGLIKAGIFDGGTVTPVPNQLKVDIQAPWKLVNKEGMVVEETSDYTRLDTPAGQITYIAVKAIYYENKNPEISFHAVEKTAFESATDREDYISFCSVNVPIGASSTLSSYIQFSDRDIVDKISRNIIRGFVTDKSFLPSAKDNKAGDLWSVADGLGNIDTPPHIYGWDGANWIVLTDSASVARDLANHRANLFTDEQHLTDLEKEAMSDPDGHRTSETSLSRDNPVVDWNDPRIPSQNENDALVGAGLSTSIPSLTNRYIFEDYPWAIPVELNYTTNSDVISLDTGIDNEFGLIFVGIEQQTQIPATRFFRLYHSTKNREYVKAADGLGVYITGVYTDSNCTIPVDSQQSIDPMVDEDGFFTGNNAVGTTLYLKCSSIPDSDFRLIYLRRQLMTRGIEDELRAVMPTNAFLNRNPESAQIAYDVIEKVENVKGRLWDDLVPTNESNIELRKDIVDLKEYVSSVFMADHVVSDFSKVEGVPDFLGHFVKNIGIPNFYKYENISQVGFAYTRDTGTVTYFSPIDTSGVIIGSDVFIDSNLNEFIVSQIVDTQNIKILKRSGSTPVTVGNSVTSTVHGSIKIDNNPRQINLALLQTIVGRERISCREVEIIPNEFHPVTNNIAFQIRTPLHSAFFKENRVRFYGGFQNIGEGNRSQVVLTGKGRVLITGFFSDLYLLASLSNASPDVSVILDGMPLSILSLSKLGTISGIDNGFEVRQQNVKICENVSLDIPHTVELIVDDATDPFIVYGFDIINKDVGNIKTLSGRAFVQSDLYKQDSITSAATTSCALRTRGVVDTKYINRNLVVSSKTTILSDFDGALPPTGSVTGLNTFEVSGSLNKFKNYSNGDVVKLITATSETILRINTIIVTTNTEVTFYSTIPFAIGTVGMLVHVASTTTESQDAIKEYNRFTTIDLSSRLLIDLFTDPILPTKVTDRIFTVEDGTTSLVAKNVRFITTGIDGMDTALEFIDNTSFIRIRAVASQLCLLLSNISDTSAQFSIDGCPLYNVSIAGGGLLNLTGWSNARYQTHELYITNAMGTKFSGFILYEPTHSTKIEGSLLGTQNLIADYSSLTLSGDLVSTGVIAVDPYTMGGVFVGSGWSYYFGFDKNDKWGRYVSTAEPDNYFEYTFLGSGIEVEYIANNDCGKPYIYLNGNLVTTTNFPGASIVGITAGTVDMYSASMVRKKFSITGLSDSTYTLSVKISNPPLRNVASSGFFINIDTVYEANSSGKLCYTPSLGYKRKDGMGDFCYGFDWIRDERNFDTGAIIKEEVPVTRTIIQETRSQRVRLSADSTEITIYLTKAFDDTNYTIPCTIENTTDPYPCFIPLVIKKKERTYFTIAWNQPLDSDNYYLNYTAVKYI
jgi:hypothetical protein